MTLKDAKSGISAALLESIEKSFRVNA